MTAASVWSFYAYKRDDETGEHDERREVADWQIDSVVSWARSRGFDTILLTRTVATVEYRRPPKVSRVTHSG